MIEESGDSGLTTEDIAQKADCSEYAADLLLESGLSAGVINRDGGRYTLTKIGYFFLRDELTRVNMDFVNDVCYQGTFNLEEALETRKPAGLRVFGEWDTIYQGLSSLPKKVQESWFAFDHYYSDSAFPEALPLVFKDKPKTLMDIGGNTGKWSIQCAQYTPDVDITILDLPGQLKKAQANIEANELTDRVHLHALDILDPTIPFPTGFDAIWMSQFLVCFSKTEILHILKRARAALSPEGTLYILDTFWDRQRYPIAAYCLINTSPYFTCMANGNSKMYRSDELQALLGEAGLNVSDITDNLGLGHSLFTCGM